MLERIFVRLLILSVQAGILIIAILAIRMLGRRLPKRVICLLWGMAALRLMIPVTIESSYSLVPSGSRLEEHITERQSSAVQVIVPAESLAVQPEASEVISAEQGERLADIATQAQKTAAKADLHGKAEIKKSRGELLRTSAIGIWLLGMAALWGYGCFGYFRVSRVVRDAVHEKEEIWLSDRITAPFLFGYRRPRIYMPFFVEESRREYIVAHERGHVQRWDHITRLVGYILLSIYWFQPLCWVGYVMFCRDTEMACDELVIARLGEEKKRAYSQTLLLCSAQKPYLLANPLAFGEPDVKNRIKNILSYKKQGRLITIASVVVVLLAGMLFMTSRQEREADSADNGVGSVSESLPASDKVQIFSKEQLAYLETAEAGTSYAVVLLANADEPMLLTAKGSYEDPAFDNRKVSFAADCLMLGEQIFLCGGGTAYPIRADHEAVYLEDGHGIEVVRVAEQENGKKILESVYYGERDEQYYEILNKYSRAEVVDFSREVTENTEKEEVAEELREALFAALMDMEGTKEQQEEALREALENRESFARLKEELTEGMKEQQAAQAAYGMPVRRYPLEETQEEYLQIAKEMFDAYARMEAVLSTSLPAAGGTSVDGCYMEVSDGLFTGVQEIKDYIRGFCSEARAEIWNGILFEGEMPLIKEKDGILYTMEYDGVGIPWTEYDDITLMEAGQNEIFFSIRQKEPTPEGMTYFVHLLWEEDRWVVEERDYVLELSAHQYYPETVLQRVDMGDYEVVLQKATHAVMAPLEAAVVVGDEMRSIELFYEEYDRAAENYRIRAVGEIMGYDCFYIYNQRAVFNQCAAFYAMRDGEIIKIAEVYNADPEESTFIRDINGDGEHELICNQFYSGDGGREVMLYMKLDGYICVGEPDVEGIDVGYRYWSYYDAETDRLVIETEQEKAPYYMAAEKESFRFHPQDGTKEENVMQK